MKSEVFNGVWVIALVMIAVPFALYALDCGLLFEVQAPLSGGAICLHMITGGLITALTRMQLLSVVRHQLSIAHR